MERINPENNPFKGRKIVIAAQDEVGYMEEDVDQVLQALGYRLEECFISDESRISDFLDFLSRDAESDKKWVEEISQKLKVPVSVDDLIVDVARRLRGLV